MDASILSEVLCEGWMVKSPPLEAKPIPGYSLFKARWRRRWFVLQQGKEPKQYLLNYYTDETKKKHKGTISLDDCEQVEHGLVDRKGNYDFMFSINTRSRTYYLAVDTWKEMDTWVSMVCKACGLRDTTAEEDHETVHSQPPAPAPIITPPVSNNKQSLPVYVNTIPPSAATSNGPSIQAKPSISSPYIHISECFSGKPQPPQPPPRSSDSYRHDSSTADDEQIYYYMPQANGTIDRDGKVMPVMVPAKNYEQPALAYIDLDLPKDDDVFAPPNSAPSSAPSRSTTIHHKGPFQSEPSSTIYKTVDFEMTKAFNQTRKDVEEKRLQPTTEHRTSSS